jgi:hypothetical protein
MGAPEHRPLVYEPQKITSRLCPSLILQYLAPRCSALFLGSAVPYLFLVLFPKSFGDFAQPGKKAFAERRDIQAEQAAHMAPRERQLSPCRMPHSS